MVTTPPQCRMVSLFHMFGFGTQEPLPGYEVRLSSRAKNISVAVHHDGRVVVTKPARMPAALVEGFVLRHAEWIRRKVAASQKRPVSRLGHLGKRDYAKHKETARILVHERIAYFQPLYGFEHGSVRIGNQKSRWGSCSAKGNLNFNYKLVFLPKELQEYVIVHELCHLKEMNHSERFWNLVEEQVPDWRAKRIELKKY